MVTTVACREHPVSVVEWVSPMRETCSDAVHAIDFGNDPHRHAHVLPRSCASASLVYDVRAAGDGDAALALGSANLHRKHASWGDMPPICRSQISAVVTSSAPVNRPGAISVAGAGCVEHDAVMPPARHTRPARGSGDLEHRRSDHWPRLDRVIPIRKKDHPGQRVPGQRVRGVAQQPPRDSIEALHARHRRDQPQITGTDTSRNVAGRDSGDQQFG
jgi:hypothetical protein